MHATNRLRLHDPRSAARHEARILRGHAKLMSDIGRHGLAELFMERAKLAVRS